MVSVCDALRTKYFFLSAILITSSLAGCLKTQKSNEKKLTYLVNYRINSSELNSIYNQKLEAHGFYFDSLRLTNKLIFAGPITDSTGVVVYRAVSIQAVEELIQNDPAVRDELLTYTINTWDVIIGKEFLN